MYGGTGFGDCRLLMCSLRLLLLMCSLSLSRHWLWRTFTSLWSLYGDSSSYDTRVSSSSYDHTRTPEVRDQSISGHCMFFVRRVGFRVQTLNPIRRPHSGDPMVFLRVFLHSHHTVSKQSLVKMENRYQALFAHCMVTV